MMVILTGWRKVRKSPILGLMLLVGTANPDKLREIAAILAGVPVRVAGTEILPPSEPVPEEGETFAANARAKALEFARRAASLSPGDRPRWVVADDSGLSVDALGGAPGVLSARYAGEDASYADNNRKLLAALAAVTAPNRGARFTCALACAGVARHAGEKAALLFEVEGSCEGTIASTERGTGGFGYDPLFLDARSGRSFAEMSPGEKNSISHRAAALRRFRERFLELLARENLAH
jgi:XTP/dITP diphosphohydrolase